MLFAGIALLGPVEEKFVQVSDYTIPANDPAKDRCYISEGYDATTHFESTVDDVLQMYTKITGKVVLNARSSCLTPALPSLAARRAHNMPPYRYLTVCHAPFALLGAGHE